MADTLNEIEEVLRRASPVDESTPLSDLRQWRRDLVQSSVFVSYATGVLSLDAEILTQALSTPSDTDLQALVDDLPRLVATGWVGGGWSLSPDAVESVVAADQLTKDYAEGLLGLHAQMVSSDLRDPEVINELFELIKNERYRLLVLHDQLEQRIRDIQTVVLHHYTTGTASVDDWLG